MKTLKKLLYFLTPREKRSAGLLLIMIIIMAFIDMMGIASILPFMAMISNPSLIETNFFLKNLLQISSAIGVENNDQFIFFLGCLVFLFLIFSLCFKAITTYAQTRFVQMRGYSVSKKLLEIYLNQPYSWFLNHNSADLGKNILSEAGVISNQALIPIFSLITHSTITIFLIILLSIVDIKLTLIIILITGGSYLIIFNFSKKFLSRIGKERLIANELRFKSISEAFGASKEVKVSGLENIFINRYSEPAVIFAKRQITQQIISIMPRFFIEAVSFGGMILLILFFISTTGNFINSIPIIAVYAFAGYRLMPSLQQIYQAVATIKFVSPSINNLYNDIKNLEILIFKQDQKILLLKNSIILNQINYNYPNSSRTALKNINLTIPAYTTVGLIGPTGCGKTTTVDIILGLITPQKGTLEIDGKVISGSNIKSWQRSIGYVPQNIYLSDDTIAANIAFGTSPNNINHEMVERVSKIANLHKFVFDELPNKYQTIIGERGVRLSGGQRQRIGIARALYNKPKVLILDEATSALDNQTEQEVMDAINNLNKKITIILIAHRLNTVKGCDIVFKLDKGQIIKQGTFDEVTS